jgi:hypothetical protein
MSDTSCVAGAPRGVHRGVFAIALCVVLLAASWLRVENLTVRSLRGDEEWFAELVQRPTWAEVEAAIVGHEQAIPAPLFTFAEHLAARWIGPGPLALRVLPCAAGIAVLVLLFALARRYAPRAPCATLLVLVAFSPFFVYWSKDAKPYSLELALFLGQLLLLERARERGYGWRALAPSLLLAPLVAGLSYASFFTFPLLGLIAGVDALRRDRPGAVRALIYGAVLASLLGLVYFGWVRHRQNDYLDEFWVLYFTPWQRPHDLVEWHLWRAAHLPNRVLVGSYAGLLGPLEAGIAAMAWLIALCGAWRLRRVLPLRFHAIALVPCALAYGASVAGIFPFEDRLLLFALALPLLYFAAGLVALWSAPRAIVAWPARALLTTGLLGFVAWPFHTELRAPATGVEASALAEDLSAALTEHAASPLAWYELATNPSQFYFDYQPKTAAAGRWLSLPEWFGFPYRERHAAAVARWLEVEQASWAVLVFTGARGFDLERRAVLTAVERERRLVRSFEATNARAYLFAPRTARASER